MMGVRKFAAPEPSLADALAEAQRICREDQYELPVGVRFDRPNPVLTDEF
jgi:hypothetical protein